MIKTETLSDGRVRTYSDAGFRIRQLDTGVIYNDAVDSVTHEYEETDELIPDDATDLEADEALRILMGGENYEAIESI